MIAIRLSLAILLFAGMATAGTSYEAVAPKDFVSHAESYQDRLVALTAEVRAVNADGNSVRLFDPASKVLIDVSVAQLTKQQRRAIMMTPVRLVSVNGRAVLINGKLVIEAHQVVFWRH